MTHSQNTRDHYIAIDLLWQPAALVRVLAAEELLAIILVLARRPPDVLTYFGLASFVIQWIVLFTLAVLYGMRHWIRRWPVPAVVACGLAVMLGVTLLSAQLASSVLPQFFPTEAWLEAALALYGCLACTTLMSVNLLQGVWQVRQARYAAKQAELAALQARVDPHFLFNTLNTGVALVHAQPDAAERLLLDLSDLFRAALASPRMVSLKEELALATRYLEIEQLRFGARLHVQVDAPRPLPVVQLPALTLQPLVENAIRHGIERRPGGGRLQVTVLDVGDEVRVVVTNPTTDATHAASDHRGHSVGQAAVEARLADMTGGRARLETREEPGRYTATVVIPR